MNKCTEDHFRWIGVMADRIICSKNQEKDYPLLSLSFLEDKKILDFFSQFSRPKFPITVKSLSDAKLYGIVVSAVAPNKKELISNSSVQYLYNFDLILDRLLNEGYIPQKPCEPTGLTEGNIEQHVNLCKSIEFLVVDRSLNIRLLTTDLLYVPRSFYVLNCDTQLILLEDAISLWLSKFHCIADFSDEALSNNNCLRFRTEESDLNNKNYFIQMDASKFAKIAGCLSRAYPDKIDKDEILNGDDEDEIQYNKKIAKSILDKMHAFVIDNFPTDEHLFSLFISDLFYATRNGVKKYVIVDHSILYDPHLPNEKRGTRSPRNNRSGNYNNKVNLSYFMSGTIDVLEDRKEREDDDMDEAIYEEKHRITPYNTLQTIKDGEELNMADAKVEERGKITPYSTLQVIKDREEFDMADARYEEKYKITPYSTLQNIKDREELSMADAKVEERGRITPYSTLQKIKDREEFDMADARDEEREKITPYSTLQNIKDREESNMADARDEEREKITPYNTLQTIKDREESNMSEAKEEEKDKITPYSTLQTIKDREESNMSEAKGEERDNITPYNTLQAIKDHEELDMSEAKDEEKYKVTPYNTLQDIKDEEEGKLQNAEKESTFNELINVPSSNQRTKNPKIIRPVVESKSSRNSVGHKTRDVNLMQDGNSQEFDSSSAERLNEQQSLNSVDRDQIDTEKVDQTQDFNQDANEQSINSNNDEVVQLDEDFDASNENSIENSASNNENAANYVEDENSNNVDDNERSQAVTADDAAYENASNDESINANESIKSDDNSKTASNESELVSKEIGIEDENADRDAAHNGEENANDDSQAAEQQQENNEALESNLNNNEERNNEASSIDESNNDSSTMSGTVNNDDAENISNNDSSNQISTINNDDALDTRDDDACVITVEKGDGIERLKSEDEEMTDEMISREEEKYRFHLKLKQLMSNSQTLTANTVPNFETISNALRYNSLPGPKYTKLLDSIIETIKEFKDERFILLMDSKTQKFKGIYILTSDGNMAEKLWGKGPNNVQNDDVSALYKYSDGEKSFDVISSKNFTQTTDGFSLINTLESL